MMITLSDRKSHTIGMNFTLLNLQCIADLKVSRNAGSKYLVCCSSPMVEAMYTKFSHVLHQSLTFQRIHCATTKFPAILDSF